MALYSDVPFLLSYYIHQSHLP